MHSKGALPVFLLAVTISFLAHAQTFTTLHSFTGGQDGALPLGHLTTDRTGNLYGTTQYGGSEDGYSGYGGVFKISQRASGWVLSPLYSFTGANDGANPSAGVTVGPNGTLFGTTYAGGGDGCQYTGFNGCGTVYNLRPLPSAPKSVIAPWTETVLYRFSGGADGANPSETVTFDQSGNAYGTTPYGGLPNCVGGGSCGVIFKLVHSNGSWTESVIHSFAGGSEGCCTFSGLIIDALGNLDGSTPNDGTYYGGTVYQLFSSGGGWVYNVLWQFDQNESFGPSGQLALDANGNIYGTTFGGGAHLAGTAFELSFGLGGWTKTILHNFTPDDGNPSSGLVLDGHGNLYGTLMLGGTFGYGSVYKLTPTSNGWDYSVLHSFTGDSDGAYPNPTVTIGLDGSLYGTTQTGSDYNYGTVWQIVP